LFMFNAGVFTADFWGQLYDNAIAAGVAGGDAVSLGGIGSQVMNCMIIMMWVFIGIEGAAVVSSRANKKSDAG
ncbi:MAG: arginine-ornithine antiporter, partial [Raoultibacter sp.]